MLNLLAVCYSVVSIVIWNYVYLFVCHISRRVIPQIRRLFQLNWLVWTILTLRLSKEICSLFKLPYIIIICLLYFFRVFADTLWIKCLHLLSSIHRSRWLWPNHILILLRCQLNSLYTRWALALRRHHLRWAQEYMSSSCVRKSWNLKYFHWYMLSTLRSVLILTRSHLFCLSVIYSLNVCRTFQWNLLSWM